MANMKLTIIGASAVDADGKSITNLSMTTGAGAAVGRCKLKVEYWTRAKKDKEWGETQSEKELTFLLTLQYAEFHKQIYCPNNIEAYILIKPEDIEDNVYRAFPSKEQLNDLFATRLVELECDGKTVCDDYYVHDIIPRRYSDRMFVTLKIYSPDKVMTLQKYCRTFTAKRLGEEILKDEIGNFSITRDGVTTSITCDTTGMKHIQTVEKDKNNKNVYTEHIFPYLVQYNESFYDFLARTTNRWGEFLYYENNKLCLGYDTTEMKISIDDIYVMSYCDWNQLRPVQSGAGTYVGDAPYDSNILKSVVTEDGYDKVKATIGQIADFDNGGDVYLMRKAASVLNNSKSITNFLFDTVVDDTVALSACTSQVAINNDNNNSAYFTDKKTNHGNIPDHDSTKNENGDVVDGVHYSTKTVDDKTKKTYNEFSEATPIVDASKYATILQGELNAGKNVVNLEFDTKYPDVKLGQVINVNNEKFIVIEVVGYQPEKIIIDKTEKSKAEARSYYEKNYNNDVVRYRVTAVAIDSDGKFYPPVLPTGHVRTSGPQVAVVVDVDDPLRGNRVRLKYPWQLADFIASHDKDAKDDDKINSFEKLTADHLKTIDVEDATPWLLYASSSGPAKAGVHGRHYLAEKVLIDYAGGNVERPYVVGSVSADVPVAIKTGSSVMMAPNGEYVKVHEGYGKGASAFVANLNPGLKMINSFVPLSFTPDNEMSRRFEGGVEMGDKYGIWSIKASTDARNVSISSPWGDVKINAFTGITISAPNGDVRISGKNVTIAAGNNLTLTSGTNIRNKFASTYDGSAKFNVLTYAMDVGKMVAKKLAQMGMNFVDLSILRSIVEVFWRPQEGALTVKSNRFLKLEAGGASAGYPDAAYKDQSKPPQKYYIPYLNDTTLDKTLRMGPNMTMIIGRLDSVVDQMIAEYGDLHKDYLKKLRLYTDAVKELKKYSNNRNDDASPCKNAEQLKDVVWTKNKKKVEENEVGFSADVAVDGNDPVDNGQVVNIIEGVTGGVKGRLSRGRNYLITTKKTGDDAKAYIVKMRKAMRADVLKAANNVLESVIKLQNMSFDTGTWTEGIGYLFGSATKYMPAEYIKPLSKAFSKENLKETAFYKYQEDINHQMITDPRRNANYQVNLFRKGALKRRAALCLVEEWGAEPQAIRYKIHNGEIKKIAEGALPIVPTRPNTDDDYEGAVYDLYVYSLEFTKLLKMETGFGMSLVKELIDKVKFWAPAEEYYSWGNAKNGQILFGTGKTFRLNGSGEIESISSVSSRNKLNRANLNEAELDRYNEMKRSVKDAMLGNWEDVQNNVAAAGVVVEQPENDGLVVQNIDLGLE